MSTKPPSDGDKRRAKPTWALNARGEPMLWLTGSALVLSLLMIVGLLTLVAWQGSVTFWPGPVVKVQEADGAIHLGELTRTEEVPGSTKTRQLLRTGNYELDGEHFEWVDAKDVNSTTEPEWALVVERLEWGRAYGTLKAFLVDGTPTAEGPEAAWEEFERIHPEVRERFHERRAIETVDIGRVNHGLERSRLSLRQAELDHGVDSLQYTAARDAQAAASSDAEATYAQLREAIDTLDEKNASYSLLLSTGSGEDFRIPLAQIVRVSPSNRLGLLGKLGIYGSRWKEFLIDEPREANAEGGVFPALFGTCLMTLVMTLAVLPFGVLAALYLREYARSGTVVRVVRIAINNLAGVPSIVFGVFGLGFFCYLVGASLDQILFEAHLPNPTFGKGGLLWASLTLALLTLPVVIVATEEALAAVPRSMREGSIACGASRWQTIRRIVLPRALPGIMTGAILAMARGAGEVAPLMLVGAVKLAPELPLDGNFPWFHGSRSFMHLGFHIYDLGFQSQNSEAAKPMVFTTTLLLIVLIAALNFAAVALRTRLRKRFHVAQF